MKKRLQNFTLLILGIILAFVFIEILLRLGGNFYLSYQNNNLQFESNTIILTLGESTTAGKDNWPTHLEKRLHELNYTNITIINKAVPAISTVYLLNELEKNLIFYDPDIVITMMGINDASSTFIYDPKSGIYKEPIYTKLRLYSLWKWLTTTNNDLTSKNVEPLPYDDDTCFPNNDVNLSERHINSTTNIQCGFNTNQTTVNQVYKRVQNDSCNYQIYLYTLFCFLENNLFQEGHEIYELTSATFPKNAEIHRIYGNFLITIPEFELAEEVYLKAKEIQPNWNHINKSLIDLYQMSGQKEKLDKLLKKNKLSFSQTSYTKEEITRYHYRLLAKNLRERDIIHIAMQYPTLSISSLKEYLEGYEETRFVENKYNFQEELVKHDYTEIFSDRFAGSFGHKTPFGNSLLIDNLLPTVEEAIIDVEKEYE